MSPVLVDTDVVSFIFKKDSRARLFRRHLTGQSLVISFMTLAELHAWALQHRWGSARREQLTRHLNQYLIHYADEMLCERWAEVDQQTRRQGQRILCADGWIAATALLLSIALVTHNPSDYAAVRDLTLLTAV